MSVTFGRLAFQVSAFDEDDILVIERLGGLDSGVRRAVSKQGDLLSFDLAGRLVGMEIFGARREWDQRGSVTQNLPDGTELVSTDIGSLFQPAEAA